MMPMKRNEKALGSIEMKARLELRIALTSQLSNGHKKERERVIN